MKKNVILREVFGSRVVSYNEDLKSNNILIIELEDFRWSDLTPKMVQAFIDIQPWTENTIRLSIECDEWD